MQTPECPILKSLSKAVSSNPKLGIKILSVLETTVIGVSSLLRMVVHSTGVFGVLEDCVSSVIFGEEFFDFPVVLLGANREFEIFAGDGIPVLSQ